MRLSRSIFLIFGIVSLSLLTGCENKEENAFWGETDFYSDFLFKKYEPVKMERTLSFDFNDDAKRLLTSDIMFEIVEKDGDGLFRRASDFDLYKNGELCPDGILTVSTSEEEATVTLIFKPDAREGTHTLYLREYGHTGLDRIDYLELTDGFVVEKNDVTNPLALLLMWTGIILITVLVVWFIIAHLVVNPATSFSRVYIQYPGQTVENEVRMRGAYRLVCTDKARKCSFLHKFFVGKEIYEVNDFWTSPLIVKTGSRSNIVRLLGTGPYEVEPDKPTRREPITVGNGNGEKTIMTTN